MSDQKSIFSKGDLVNFEAKPWVFKSAEKRYKNPGVILNVYTRDWISTRVSYEVYWSDGKITNEFETYIVRATSEPEEGTNG